MSKKLIIAKFFVLMALGSVQAQEVLDGIMAIVGDEIILRSEWLQEAEGVAVMQRINPATQVKEFDQIKKAVLENLISSRIMLVKAEEDTVTVEDAMVQAELDNKIMNMVSQLGSEEKVEAHFGKPISRIKKDFFEEQKKLLIVNKVQQEKMQPIQVSRREVEQFYATKKDSLPQRPPMVKLRHILKEVNAGAAARNAALQQINEIEQKLESGEDFAELAKQFSQDPGSASRGGELGFVGRGTFVPEFDAVAFQLRDGETSGIVETQFGFHIIRMIEHRGEEINARHILIQLPKTDEDAALAEQEINSIRSRILAGASFADVAKEVSDDLESKARGGDLDWLPKNALQIREFRLMADTLTVGKVSQPFKTQFGYHIVKMEDKQDAGPLQLEQDWDQINNMALSYKKQKVLQAWINELKKNIHVEVREDLL